MLRYEKTRFAAWCGTVDAAVTAGVQQPLLARVSSDASGTVTSTSDAAAGAAVGTPGPPLKAGGPGSPGAGTGAGVSSSGGGGPPGRLAINFPSGLLLMMREAKYLDQLGLAVPPLAVNLALQEGQLRCVCVGGWGWGVGGWGGAGWPRGEACRAWCARFEGKPCLALRRWLRPARIAELLPSSAPSLVPLRLPREHFQELGGMLERHAAASAPLRSAERALLSEQLAALEAVLEPGLTRINWSSLTIPDFVAGVNKVRRTVGQDRLGAHAGQRCPSSTRRAVQQPALLVCFPPDPVLPPPPLPTPHTPHPTHHKHTHPPHPTPPHTPPPQAVDQFNALVAQVQKNTGLIEKVLYHISRARLVPPDAPPPGSGSGGSGAAAGSAARTAAPAASSAEQQQMAEAPAGEEALAPAEQPAAGTAGAAAAEPAEGAGAAAAAPDVPTLQEFYEDFEQHRQQVGWHVGGSRAFAASRPHASLLALAATDQSDSSTPPQSQT